MPSLCVTLCHRSTSLPKILWLLPVFTAACGGGVDGGSQNSGTVTGGLAGTGGTGPGGVGTVGGGDQSTGAVTGGFAGTGGTVGVAGSAGTAGSDSTGTTEVQDCRTLRTITNTVRYPNCGTCNVTLDAYCSSLTPCQLNPSLVCTMKWFGSTWERGCGYVREQYEGDVGDRAMDVWDETSGKLVYHGFNGMTSSGCFPETRAGTEPACSSWTNACTDAGPGAP